MHRFKRKPSADLLSTRSITGLEIIQQVAISAEAVVYEARQCSLDRKVALKVSLRRDQRGKSRFQREVLLLQELEHPNIAKIYGAGEIDGYPYLLMEWLNGLNLSQAVGEHGPMAADELSSLLIDVLDALEYSHSRNIAHRDVKPSNIFVVAKASSAELYSSISDSPGRRSQLI